MSLPIHPREHAFSPRQGVLQVLGALLYGASGVMNIFLASLLTDLPASDPVTFGAVSLGLMLSAVAASYIPARRAR